MRILLLLVLITGYCNDSCGKARNHPAYSIMANGEETYYGAIACPPEWEFGTVIVIPELGTFECADRGGAIRSTLEGRRIDIWFETCKEAVDWGIRQEQVLMPIERRQP